MRTRPCEWDGQLNKDGGRELPTEPRCTCAATHRVSMTNPAANTGDYSGGWKACAGHLPLIVERGSRSLPQGFQIRVVELETGRLVARMRIKARA